MEDKPIPKSYPQASSSNTPQHPQTIPIAFISGPQDIDAAYFETHYIPPIKNAIAQGHRFILGPSRGVDAFALDYLRKSGLPTSRIRLYLNTSEETRVKPIFRRFEEAGGSVVMVKGGHAERDEMMTRNSHYDILRNRTEEEARALYGELYMKNVSGAEMNALRRKSGVGLVLPKSQ
ncbi:hypothetical protein BDN70DRAFT_831367 [Pholiota conissans]|uniref:Uncharacterized protein n=1 Tax=Pholiota conissans TaxID=109636 RepID=A0A9P6CVX7_9AGAR|nr:hypothetical protein BDN70DRAFT_831367 [Pholiota conissans]